MFIKIIIFYFINYIKYKIIKLRNRKKYFKRYIKYNKIKPFFLKESSKIPKIIHLTHYDKNRIPEKVWKNLNIFANDYKIKYYSDKQCINFLEKNYNNEIVSIFKNLSTCAHKADLFRYCVLYKIGGIYLDIKIVPVKQLIDIFDHNKSNLLYTVLSRSHIFQGIIASYASNPIFVDLINDFYYLENDFFYKNMNAGDTKYHYFTKKFYTHIQNRNSTIHQNKKLKRGVINFSDQNIILFEEKNIQINNEKKDIYGFWNIFNNFDERIFKSRYNDYPW